MKSVYVKELTDRFGKQHRSFLDKVTASLTPLAAEAFMSIIEEKDYSQKKRLQSIIAALRGELAEYNHWQIDKFLDDQAPWAKGEEDG